MQPYRKLQITNHVLVSIPVSPILTPSPNITVPTIVGLTCDLSHNDVHEGNCLIDPNQMVDGKSEMEALRLIDFEYSNYGYR